MNENRRRDIEIKVYWLSGGNRASAMEKWGLTTGQLTGISTRMRICWSWPFKNRRSGIEPLSAQTQGPRKPSETGGGVITSIKARASRVARSENLEVAPDAPLYETPSPLRRHYGHSTRLSSREKYERGLVDKDSSIDRSAAFEGIDPEVVAAFAPFYK